MAAGIARRGCGVSEQEAAGEPELNAAAIVAALNRHQVRYVIIGAFAAIAQRAPIPATRDIDLTPEASATLPVDDRLDMPDRKSIAGLCDLVGSLISPPLCHDDEKAMIVLRRPGPAEIGEADAYIFRLVRQAGITTGRPRLGRSMWWGRTEYER
jgi:hypothetical protein